MKEYVGSIIGSFLVVIVVTVFFAWLFHFQYSHAIPATGCVAEKIQAGSGYQDSIHVLKLDVGKEEFVYITISEKVYNIVVAQGCYEFTGPRNGTSYDGVRVVEQ